MVVRDKKRKKAYILMLPSLFTTGTLFCGFYSIIHSFNESFEKAAYAILLAGVFDLLDGRVARITGSMTQFGMEYDSLADVVSFGLAPALLCYVWQLQPLGRLGWAAAFFFAACGALRLARFNSMSEEMPKSYFLGLPIPGAAAMIATLVIMYQSQPFPKEQTIFLILSFFLGFLMVSNVRYRSSKDMDLRHNRSFFHLVLLVMVVAFVTVHPEVAFASIVAAYVLWAPFREVLVFVKRKLFRKEVRHRPIPDDHTSS